MQKFELVNGFLFTGGWCKEGLYFDVVEDIFKVCFVSGEVIFFQ